jgi:hypothetical protein
VPPKTSLIDPSPAHELCLLLSSHFVVGCEYVSGAALLVARRLFQLRQTIDVPGFVLFRHEVVSSRRNVS